MIIGIAEKDRKVRICKNCVRISIKKEMKTQFSFILDFGSYQYNKTIKKQPKRESI